MFYDPHGIPIGQGIDLLKCSHSDYDTTMCFAILLQRTHTINIRPIVYIEHKI